MIKYLESMKWLHDRWRICRGRRRREYSIKRAAQKIAAEDFVDGISFETVAKDLETRYAEWKKKDFPQEKISDLGNARRQVWVTPKSNSLIPFPGRRETVPANGALVTYTSYWRMLFDEGSITISCGSNIVGKTS